MEEQKTKDRHSITSPEAENGHHRRSAPNRSGTTAAVRPAIEMNGPGRTIMQGFIYYGRVLLRRRTVIIIITIVATALAVGFCVVSKRLPASHSPLPNVYTASAELFVQGNGAGLADLSGVLGTGAGSSSTKGPDYGAIAIAALESRPFLDSLSSQLSVVSRYHITKDTASSARAAILAHAKFNYDPTTNLLVIQYTDIDPEFAATMTNTMVDLLGKWFSDRIANSTMRTEKLISDKLDQVKSQMAKLQAEIARFQKQYGVLSVDELSRERSNIIGTLQSQLVLVETNIRTRSATSTIEDPVLAGLKSQRQSLLDTISQVKAGSGPYAETMPSGAELTDLSSRMSTINDDLAAEQKIYQTLTQQYQLLRIDTQATPIFQVFERAEVPTRKSGPHRSMIVIAAALLGFIASVAGALFAHGLSRARSQVRGGQNE